MPRNKRPEDEPHLSPQVTLRGRNAWVLQVLLEARGGSLPEVAAWVIDQWIDGEGRKQLMEVYDIDIRDWNRRSNVVAMREKKKRDGNVG